MTARLDRASLAFPLRWFAATCLMFAVGEAIRAFDDALAELGGEES